MNLEGNFKVSRRRFVVNNLARGERNSGLLLHACDVGAALNTLRWELFLAYVMFFLKKKVRKGGETEDFTALSDIDGILLASYSPTLMSSITFW
mmetsp:Transcript_21591/g.30248  ORF Transcript_21591/g.30248 Transcript_21591/m.30248 type:complete len:94 (+) Transcript_21591:390-671(+)